MTQMMSSAMVTPASSRSEIDPIAEMVSDLLNYPNGLPEPRVIEAGGSDDNSDTADNIRIAVELLLGAKKGDADYKANLEIARGYINKELATC
jgi:hypothetical protein